MFVRLPFNKRLPEGGANVERSFDPPSVVETLFFQLLLDLHNTSPIPGRSKNVFSKAAANVQLFSIGATPPRNIFLRQARWRLS